jgi:phage tail sheath protein FI
MPEYLAPGVYVEEVDTGDKPIEGVSTSTAGMVGLTARGPVGVPSLVTSVADFTRQFGGRLDHRQFPADTAHLPLAIEGFFANSGKRVYVVRVLPDGAAASQARIFDRGDGAWTARLGSVAARGDTLLLVSAPTSPIGSSDWFLVDDPSGAEFLKAQQASVVALETPLVHALATGDSVSGATLTPGPAAATTLTAPATAGQSTFEVADATNIKAGDLLIVGAKPARDVVRVASAKTTTAPAGTVTVTAPLAYDQAANAAVQPVTAVTNASPAAVSAAPGDCLVAVQGPPGTLPSGGDMSAVSVGTGASEELHFIGDGEVIDLNAPLAHGHPSGTAVAAASLGPIGAPRHLTAKLDAGAVELPLDDVSGIVKGTVLALASDADLEHAVVEVAPGGAGAGTVALVSPVARDHPNGTAVTAWTDNTGAAPAGLTTLAKAAHPGDWALYVTDRGTFQPADVPRVGGPGGDYVTQTAGATRGEILVLAMPAQGAHRAGLPVGGRAVIGSVQAVDLGAWGNGLQIKFDDEDAPILDTVPAAAAAPGALQVTLASTTGIEPGTILEFYTGTAAKLQSICIQRVASVAGATRTVTLDTGLTAAVATNMHVRTREFKMTVQGFQLNPRTLVEQPVSALSETIRQLSMDPGHSRYFVKVVGAMPTAAIPHTDGESLLVRVGDDGAGAPGALRLGPDTHPQRLAGGDDSLGTLGDDTYLGNDDIDPAARTGLQALKNIEEISLVAIPGITTQDVQNGLIDQCELLRYRFAVLDAHRGNTIAQVQQQRNLYDTRYAALYYPWLDITDPFPANPRAPAAFPVPPSGHVMGIYARVDNDRGVHKAPANEVLLGIDSLEVRVVKEQQDILNPRNINVLRDFTDHQRGLRVWGARCLTSDPDWKYVNVRRLFIFLEASLDRGTQWVVFEPNDEQTWARVRQSVTAFLTDVWRDGALMGKTADQAFFVKCDTTTMTQADIDNGRLILIVGVAPVRPAEFVIIRIGQWAGGAMTQQA